ncbi:hypothetical protein PLEOSDRAFT_170843 [Pleurotus ostreatus PC15]|uniref:Uncharacterized protein n=1 Tax=Pleurotus ostreatus (strain PC15) TaxID=1137138 RepID=A0A067N842_PLEO1|nr:hypothetical protein PLEOSDRAFT_170843 [Pleurotus ostreatus PC15]
MVFGVQRVFCAVPDLYYPKRTLGIMADARSCIRGLKTDGGLAYIVFQVPSPDMDRWRPDAIATTPFNHTTTTTPREPTHSTLARGSGKTKNPRNARGLGTMFCRSRWPQQGGVIAALGCTIGSVRLKANELDINRAASSHTYGYPLRPEDPILVDKQLEDDSNDAPEFRLYYRRGNPRSNSRHQSEVPAPTNPSPQASQVGSDPCTREMSNLESGNWEQGGVQAL